MLEQKNHRKISSRLVSLNNGKFLCFSASCIEIFIKKLPYAHEGIWRALKKCEKQEIKIVIDGPLTLKERIIMTDRKAGKSILTENFTENWLFQKVVKKFAKEEKKRFKMANTLSQ